MVQAVLSGLQENTSKQVYMSVSDNYNVPLQIRWADLDSNGHLRHSAYYDFASTVRINFLSDRGLTINKLAEFRLGPVLFREEAIFKKEIHLEDKISVSTELTKSTSDYSRWSFRHQFTKEDGTIAAFVNVDAAWINLDLRKLGKSNDFIVNVFSEFKKSDDFQWVVPSTKKS